MTDYKYETTRGDNAQVTLTITVPKEIVTNTYNTTIQDIAKKAIVKGFRKGKVPVTVLEQKYGEGIRADATDKVMNEAIPNILEKIDLKPLHFSMPELHFDEKNPDPNVLMIKPNTDFKFSVVYDTMPKIEPGEVKSLTLEEPKLKIADSDIERELKLIQERNAFSVNRTDGIKENDSVVYDIVQLDEKGVEIANTKLTKQTLEVHLPAPQDYLFNKDVIGMKVKDTKKITKKYTTDHFDKKLAGNTVIYNLTITEAKYKDLPAIDDDLAQDVNQDYKTLADLKTHLKSQIETRARYMIENLHNNQLLEYMLENSRIEVPKSAVSYQLESRWKSFIKQYGGNEKMLLDQLKQLNQSKEQFVMQWQPEAKKDVAMQYLIVELIQKEKISLTEQELETKIKEEAKTEEEFTQFLDYYKKNNLMPQIKFEYEQKLLLETMRKRTIIKAGKTYNFVDLEKYIEEKNNELNENAQKQFKEELDKLGVFAQEDNQKDNQEDNNDAQTELKSTKKNSTKKPVGK